ICNSMKSFNFNERISSDSFDFHQSSQVEEKVKNLEMDEQRHQMSCIPLKASSVIYGLKHWDFEFEVRESMVVQGPSCCGKTQLVDHIINHNIKKYEQVLILSDTADKQTHYYK